MEILLKSWKEAEVDAFLVRQEVFILEQGVPAELELDELDSVCEIIVAITPLPSYMK